MSQQHIQQTLRYVPQAAKTSNTHNLKKHKWEQMKQLYIQTCIQIYTTYSYNIYQQYL